MTKFDSGHFYYIKKIKDMHEEPSSLEWLGAYMQYDLEIHAHYFYIMASSINVEGPKVWHESLLENYNIKPIVFKELPLYMYLRYKSNYFKQRLAEGK